MGFFYFRCAAGSAAGATPPRGCVYIIGADAGVKHLERLGARPDLIVGDFDSLGHVPVFPNIEVCPVEKDDTDSMIALKHALTLGFGRIFLFGALGGRRLDHTLANIQALAYARAHGAECFLFGEGCALTAISDGDALRFDGRYSGDFSAFCHGPDASGVTERGLYYSLDGAELTSFFPLGVSNSFTGAPAEIPGGRAPRIASGRATPALPPRERGSEKKDPPRQKPRGITHLPRPARRRIRRKNNYRFFSARSARSP